jgi:soluble lytic murein transglycosylase-like protein
MAIPFLACMLAVAAELHLPPRILPAIQAVEGGRVGFARANSNGTEDLGLMQVNSLWLPMLSQHTSLPPDALRDKLVRDGCFNVAVAGVIMRIYLRETRGDILAAVGNYHSHTPPRHLAYRDKVVRAAIKMFETRPTQTNEVSDRR